MRGRRRSLRSLATSEGGVTVVGLVVLLTAVVIADAVTGGRFSREYTEGYTGAYDDAYRSLGAVRWVALTGAILLVVPLYMLLWRFGRRWGAAASDGVGDACVRAASLPLPSGVRARFLEEWRDALVDLRDRDAPRHRRVAELVDIVVHVPVLVVVLRARSRATEER